jgi:RNA polymerase sigma-70 factor (sigma-E family)
LQNPTSRVAPSGAEQVAAVPFVEFYRARFVPMVRLAVAITGSEAAAEDIVHDAFLRVHARWLHVDSPNAYLRVVVVNACRSAHRRRLRERRIAAREAATVAHLDADEMFDALLGLPFRQRAALVLRYYEDLSDADIARVLDCRPGTVASLIHRGLAQLRRVIEP